MLDQLFPDEIVHDLERIRGEIQKVKEQYSALKNQIAKIQNQKTKLKKEISKIEKMIRRQHTFLFKIRIFVAKYFGMCLFTRKEIPQLLYKNRLQQLNRDFDSLLYNLFFNLNPQLTELSRKLFYIEIYEKSRRG